ncbi:hypothetical protein GCM10023189_37850 [Nibrella saemangeumensis]|uniref:Uncharacterized protein n=1 Tax=Nibrella saemangeumensis TaxID=1084526 RepID=A0ABP8N8U0_9BACT
MRFKETIHLHDVAIDVTGEYEPAERGSYDYPGSPAEVYVTRYEIGGVDVSNLIDAADWYEEIDREILKAMEEPAL